MESPSPHETAHVDQRIRHDQRPIILLHIQQLHKLPTRPDMRSNRSTKLYMESNLDLVLDDTIRYVFGRLGESVVSD